MKKFCKNIIPIFIIAMLFFSITKYVYASVTNLKIGDINGDGEVNSLDRIQISQHIAASRVQEIAKEQPTWILKNEQLKAGDINGDGTINPLDRAKVSEYIAAIRVPEIAKENPTWKTYIESKWEIEATSITLDKTSITLEKGKTTKLIATIEPSNVTNKIVTWSSSDTKIATVDGIGNIDAKGTGLTIITATTKNGKNTKCEVKVTETTTQSTVIKSPTTNTSSTIKSTLTPTTATTPAPTTKTPVKTATTPTKNIANLNVALNPTQVTYNGKPQTPSVTVKDGNTVLKNGTNYILTYSKNINAGTAIVTITGKGNYKGIVTKSFKINKATYNMNSVKFTNSTVTYDGKAHSITATGVPSGVKVTYIGNGKVAVGTYTITAKFTGNTTNYNTIADRKATLKINAKPVTSRLEYQTIKVNGKTLTKGQYANFRNVKTGKIGQNVLYRCINPILPYSDKQKEPAYYADQLLKAHNVRTILNLSDNISKIKMKGYSKSTYYKSLLNSGKVYLGCLTDNGSFDTKSKKQDIVKGLRFFIKNEGPYAIHCKWGQGRTGMVVMLLECLMEAPYDYIYNDFTTTFKNFKLVGKNTSSNSYNKEFSKYMKSITGKGAANSSSPKASDWKKVNLSKCAENYLKAGGMTNSEIQTLKNHLSKNY